MSGRGRLGQRQAIRQAAVLRCEAMDLSAVRAEQADGKLLNVREAFHIRMDAADDVAAGRRTSENKSTHGTIY